ncbi:MAG: Ig-like domain-containing protein [Spirochaetota bacterium]
MVLWVSVEDGQRILDIDAFKRIDISFSKPMNRYITESNITLSGYFGTLHFLWEDGNCELSLLLGETLEGGNRYVLKIGEGCECEDGYDLGKNIEITFYTYDVDDDFMVLSTSPSDGEIVGVLDSLAIMIEFSLPVEYTTIYEKVTISPRLIYNYSFSADRKRLILHILEHASPYEHYTINVDQELSALKGRRLEGSYSFSFSTVVSTDAFLIERAVMVDKGESPPGIDLDTGWLATTRNIEKDMELIISFNKDFYLNQVEGGILLEPSISFEIMKEGMSLRFVFKDPMVQEEMYQITLETSIKSADGISLNRTYSFIWIVDGIHSRYCKPISVYMINPDLPEPDTLVYDDGVYYHNRIMPLNPRVYYNDVEFQILFSSPIDVYRSLNGIQLRYIYGNPGAASGELTGYSWNYNEKLLFITFSLPVLDSGGDGYYKFILQGGDDGLVDCWGNPMKDSIEVYVVYEIQE